MSKLNWHQRTVSVLKEMASDWGYEPMYPSRVYIRDPDGRVVFYNPDAIWLAGQRGIQIVLWEAETSSNAKAVVGDASLASLTRTSFAEFYPWEDFEIGSRFKNPVKFQDTYDRRKPSQVMQPDERRRFYGSEITHLSLFIVSKDEDWASYYERYLHILTRKQWGKENPFDIINCFACEAGNRKTSRRSIGRRLSKFL